MRDDAGERLCGLQELGIGALYLGGLPTPFTLTGTGGEPLGRVSRSSFWLGESGAAGLLQHVDLYC